MSCPHSAVALRACRRRSQCAVWCFRGLWVWRVLVPVIEITAVFVRLRLRLRQRRPPATPASDARQRRPPATPASDARQRRLGTTRKERAVLGVVSVGPVNNRGTSLSNFPRNTTVRSFGAFPASFAVLRLWGGGRDHTCAGISRSARFLYIFFDLFSIYGTSGHRQLTSEPDR